MRWLRKHWEICAAIGIVAIWVAFDGFGAWISTFDTDTPASSDDIKEGDDRIREVKAAIQERLNCDADGTEDEGDIIFVLDGSNEVSDMAAGEHRQVTFNERAADPAPASLVDKLFLFAKNDGDNCELYAKDEQGNVFQLTKNGAPMGATIVSTVKTVTADYTLPTATTWTTLPLDDANYVAVTVTGDPLEIVFISTWDYVDNQSGTLRLRIKKTDSDGTSNVEYMGTRRFSFGGDAGDRYTLTLIHLETGVAAETYRFSIQYYAGEAGQQRINGDFPAQFYVKELRQ